MPKQHQRSANATKSQAPFWRQQQRIDALSAGLSHEERTVTLEDSAAFQRAYIVGRRLLHQFEAEFARLDNGLLGLITMLGETG